MTDVACMQTALSRFIPAYQQQHRLSPAQGKVCRHLGQCRTPALGGQRVQCDQCGFTQHRYHSCRNRHCPKCQHHASQDWCDKQLQQVLPVNTFHVVFTLPHALNPWVQCHPEVLYRCLFQAVWKTIQAFGRDPKRLGGQMGMTAVLHTWGQNLLQHVHLHCLIPGGALSDDQQQWHAAKSNYLFPVRALSRHFRGAMVSALRGAYRDGELHRLEADAVEQRLSQLMQHDWIVYSKAWLKKPASVVRYLSRYTHKIAISDSRIKAVTERQVIFRYKDYRDNQDKDMRLDGEEFIRRFLLHVLPEGLMRIRHYGFLSNRSRQQKGETIRTCLQAQAQLTEDEEVTLKTNIPQLVDSLCPCPKCHIGHLHIGAEIPPEPRVRR